MGTKLTWTGLTLMIASQPFLGVLGFEGRSFFKILGAVFMVVGTFLILVNK